MYSDIEIFYYDGLKRLGIETFTEVQEYPDDEDDDNEWNDDYDDQEEDDEEEEVCVKKQEVKKQEVKKEEREYLEIHDLDPDDLAEEFDVSADDYTGTNLGYVIGKNGDRYIFDDQSLRNSDYYREGNRLYKKKSMI